MINNKNRPLVSVIIVNWNGKHLLNECLVSLRQQVYPNWEVILVDNGSTDGSVEYVKKDFPWVHVLPLDKNYGFAEGNNRGLKVAKGDYIFLLNSDATIDPQCVSELIKIIEQDHMIGCCAPLICFQHDKKIVNSAGCVFDNVGFCWDQSFGKLVESITGKEIREVPMATGCAMLISRRVLEKTYLFDPSFFMYCEDFDFALRVREIGYKVVLVPSSLVYHKFSASQTSQLNLQPTLFKKFYGQRNRAKILAKYYPFRILLKNFHIIALSFIYWDLFILRYGGIKKFIIAIIFQIQFTFIGYKERIQRRNNNAECWVKYMSHHSLKDLILFGIHRRELYNGKIPL